MGQDISVSHQVALLDTAFIPEFTLIMTNLLPQFLITLGYFVASLHVPLAQPILKLPRRCSQPRLIYNLTSENAPTINGVTNASFVNNHLVHLKIWTEGPRTSEFALPGFRSEPNAINLDIDQGTLSRVKRSIKPITEVCARCQVKVIAESPNAQWQLVQVTSSREKPSGIWLIGQAISIRLISFQPIYLDWQWDNASKKLLISYPELEYGSVNLIVSLTSNGTPAVTTLPEGPIPTHYLLDKVSGRLYGTSNITTSVFGIFDINSTTPTVKSTMQFESDIQPIWDQHEKRILLATSFPTYATLADLKGVTFYVLPLETRLSSLTGSAIAISPDKNRIVIADTFRRVFLYDCRAINEVWPIAK